MLASPFLDLINQANVRQELADVFCRKQGENTLSGLRDQPRKHVLLGEVQQR